MKPMVCAMPACQGAGAGHLRSVVGNDHAIKIIVRQDGEDAEHIHVAFVDKCLAVIRNLAHHVAQMDVGNFSLPAVAIDRVVDVAFRHLGQRSHAKLQGIARAGGEIDQTLIHGGLVDQSRLAAHGGHGRIVGMGRQAHARLFGDWHDVCQKSFQAAP